MKSLILLAIAGSSLALTSCTTTVVRRDYHPYHPYRREVVVVGAAPAPYGAVYYTDYHGRYYWGRHHRRVYVTVY